MFSKIFLFEIRYRLKRPATYAYFAILFLFTFLNGIYGNGPASEKAFVNSPYAIGQFLLIISIFGSLISSAVMGVPVFRDIEYQTRDYFFTYPITEKSYLLGRFAGSFVILMCISFGEQLGMVVGPYVGVLTGQIEPERIGPFSAWNYLYSTLVLSLPNFFFTGTIFFSLVALTRKILVTYVGCVLLLAGYIILNVLTRDIEYKTVADLLDPFALNTYNNATKYWSPAEQNTNLIPVAGNFLWNRVIWIGLSLLIFSFTLFKFSFQSMMEKASGNAKKVEDAIEVVKGKRDLPLVTKLYSRGIYFQKLIRLSVLEFKNITRDFYFIAIYIGAILFLFIDGWVGNKTYGTPSLPSTISILEAKGADYATFVFIIFIFITGEAVHRDKSVNYSSISDALPIPNWVVYGSKFFSLVLVGFVLLLTVVICGVIIQASQGYFNFEFGVYFTDLVAIDLPQYLQMIMLAFIVHILVNNKFMGHVITIGIWIVLAGIQGFAQQDYNLLFYSNIPYHTWSDMNGFGHFLKSVTWFNIYWLCLGIVFLLLGNLFWNRGSETSFSARLKPARQRLTPAAATWLTTFTILWLACGGYIYYNVSVLNSYRTPKENILLGVEFEKKYKKYEFFNQPKVTDVNIKVDIFPMERHTVASGRFVIVNKTKKPIDSLLLNIGSPVPHTYIKNIAVDGKQLKRVMNDSVHRFYCYQLPRVMNPGDTMSLELDMDAHYIGFTNGGSGRELVYNGTFFSDAIFPGFGYPGDPISSDKERKKYGLPKKEYTQPPQNDPHGLSTLLFNQSADFITFQAIVSTDKDQIAIAPGYLTKEWEENGRKYFQYKMDNPMDLMFNISSARYEVNRDVWTSKEGQKVNLEIFHDKKHTYNLDRFNRAMKVSMDYFSENFRPYQHKQIRILEFPRYATFAQSFSNTVPFAESFGWLGDFSDPDKTDYVFFVTAHELAHQWWGHQISPSFTRGANQISESMAQYSALMVLQKEYGQESMQQFLKYELDSYLRGRSGEDKFEATLLDNDTRAYVWYRKGAVVLYALQDLIGEKTLNAAFKKFADSAAFRQKPPFPNSYEWYGYIKRATPDSLRYFTEDSFEKIALYENKITKATYEPSGKQFKVKLTVQTKKLYYDGQGKEISQGTGKDLIDIGIFDENGKNDKGMTKKVPIYLKKHWLTPGTHELEFIVDKKPIKAGIDPYNKLIDRIPDDNMKKVDEK